MTHKQIAAGFVLGALFFGSMIAFFSTPSQAGSEFTIPAFTAATSSSITVGPQENIRVVASSTRSYLYLANTTGLGEIFCRADGDKPAVLNQGIELSTSTENYYEMYLEKNPYDGAVRCTATASTTLSVTQYNRR